MSGDCESIKAVVKPRPERFSPAKIRKLCELVKHCSFDSQRFSYLVEHTRLELVTS